MVYFDSYILHFRARRFSVSPLIPIFFGDANDYQKISVSQGVLEREGHDPVEIEVKSSTLIPSYLAIIRAHTLEIKAKQRGLESNQAYERH